MRWNGTTEGLQRMIEDKVVGRTTENLQWMIEDD